MILHDYFEVHHCMCMIEHMLCNAQTLVHSEKDMGGLESVREEFSKPRMLLECKSASTIAAIALINVTSF